MTADLATLQMAAQSALAREDWSAAERALEALARAAPGNPSLHYNLGLVRKRLNADDQAVADFRRTLDLDPSHANAQFELAASLLDLGQLEEAEATFRIYLDAVPDDTDAVLNLARILLRSGSPEEARGLLDRVGARSPAILLAKAEAARDCGNVDVALTLLAEVEATDGDVAARRLKIATQGPAGRIALDPAQLFAPRR